MFKTHSDTVTTDTMLKYDSDFHEHGHFDGTCEQTLKIDMYHP